MSNNQETIADIVAEWRESAKRCKASEEKNEAFYSLADMAMIKMECADRIEAAWKRERDHLLNEIANAAAGY